MAWGTVARWLESAATYAVRFNNRMLKGFLIRELQADEIRTFIGAKKRVSWVLTTLEVGSGNTALSLESSNTFQTAGSLSSLKPSSKELLIFSSIDGNMPWKQGR